MKRGIILRAKSVLAAFICLCMAASVLMTGCGEDKSKTESTTAPATTVAATTAGKSSKTSGSSQQNDNGSRTNSSNDSSQSSQSDDGSSSSSDGLISESEAAAKVRQLEGTAAQVINSYEGTAPDGSPAWIITVSRVTTGDAQYVTYYVGNDFCYCVDEDYDSDDQSSDGYSGTDITEEEAIAMVRQQAGSRAQIISSYEGYTPDGIPAWVITVAPVSKSADSETVTYYAGYGFCYAA